MAWNEPGDKNDKDPWGRKKDNQSPPELDQLLQSMQKKLSGLMGGSKGGNDAGPSSTGSRFSVGLIIAIIVGIWVLSGIYIVKPAEKAVVTRFGKYHKTVGDGPHWAPRLIDTVYKINEQKIDSYSYTADMLTKDENIVTVSIAIQYRIANARDFLFNVVSPVSSLQEATASALRQVIGNTTLDAVLTYGRENVRAEVQEQLSAILDKYKLGIIVVDVALQPAKAPDQVKEAFDNAIKAEQEKEQIINLAQAYREQAIPQARGQEQRLLASANAYKQQMVLNAQGETARYLAYLPQYKLNPAVTRERLYLATMEHVLSKSSKVFVDSKGNNLFLYMPFEQLLAQAEGTSLMSDSPDASNFGEKIIPPMAASSTPVSAPTTSTTTTSEGYLTGSSSNDASTYMGDR